MDPSCGEARPSLRAEVTPEPLYSAGVNFEERRTRRAPLLAPPEPDCWPTSPGNGPGLSTPKAAPAATPSWRRRDPGRYSTDETPPGAEDITR